MDVAKVIRKVVPPKPGEINSLNKSSLSRLQATKNHVCTMRAGTCSQGSATDGSKSSKGRPPKPDLRPKPQALVEMMRQEKLAKKFGREGIKDSNDDCIDNEVADDSGDESGGPTVEMRFKGVNLKFEDSVFVEEKASDEIEAKTAVTKSSGISSDVTITSSPTLPQASLHDTVEKPNHDHHTKETSKLVISDTISSISQQKDAKRDDHKKSHEEHSISPTSFHSSGDFSSSKPSRLHMRAVVRHKSESSSPRDLSVKSSTLHLLNKQSSDISFDRGRGNVKKLTSGVPVHVGDHSREGGVGGEDFTESTDVIDDNVFCEEGGESFRTRVARFAREKFHRALSLGSPQLQLQSSMLTPGTCL